MKLVEEIKAEIRKIVHLDMDAFYASVEQRDNPALRGMPIAVTDPKGWGIIAAASYEARAIGVRAGTSAASAIARWPQLEIIEPRLDVYESLSAQAHQIYARYSGCIEPIFLDEAYLDVTETTEKTSATALAKRIRADIWKELELIVSAGVSYNKFLAKLASDHCKPNGLLVIPPGRAQPFIDPLPVGKFHGVGPATEARMLALGIETGEQLRAASLECLVHEFGRGGQYFYDVCRGIDERPVSPPSARRSHGIERSFKHALLDDGARRSSLAKISAEVWAKCELSQSRPRTVTIKVRFTDFSEVTKSHSAPDALSSQQALALISERLLNTLAREGTPIRLLGISLSALTQTTTPPLEQQQLCLDLQRDSLPTTIHTATST